MAYDKPTIQDEGGIAAHVRNMGLNWSYFIQMDDKEWPNTRIGRELASEAGRDKPVDGRTIAKWKQLRMQEQSVA